MRDKIDERSKKRRLGRKIEILRFEKEEEQNAPFHLKFQIDQNMFK